MNYETYNILLIEDSPDDQFLIQEMLKSAVGITLNVDVVDHLRDGLVSLGRSSVHTGVDLVLLDLSLPDSVGLGTVASVREYAPELPIVILTGLEDEEQAVQAMREGVQDYLVKQRTDNELLSRSIRYAIERNALQLQLRQVQGQAQRDKEIRRLSQMDTECSSTITAQMFGQVALQEAYLDTFNELVRAYQELLDLALEQRTSDVRHPISDRTWYIAEKMGNLFAGPRDAVDVHKTAIQRTSIDVPFVKAQAYVEEGRFLLLELMGYLVSYYRRVSLGTHERRI